MYYARFSVGGKKTWQSLRTKLKSVAEPRLSNPENLPFKSPPESQTKRPEIRLDLYILINNEVQGPYQEDQILEMMDSGHINDDTQVCPEGSEQWISFKAYCDYM